MLPPEYFDGKADRVIELYRKLEDFIMRDIATRILKAGELTATADRLLYKLQQAGQSREAIEQELSKLTGIAQAELRTVLQNAVIASWAADKEVLAEIATTTLAPPLENRYVREIMDAQYKMSLGELSNLTRTTMWKSQQDLIQLLDEADMRTASGAQSYSQAASDILDAYAGKGVMVEYPTGTRRTVEAAVRCCVVTSMNQTAAQITDHYIQEAGAEYVIVSAHPGARIKQPKQPPLADHAGWQGKTYKIRGSEPGYPNLLDSTGYGIDPDTGTWKVVDPLGLHGYNCRHSHGPWAKGRRNPWLDENGKPLIDSEESRKRYELSQQQRAMERAVRATKRKLMMKQTELELAPKSDLESLQADFDRLSVRLTNQNGAYNAFCKENGLQPQYDRNKVARFNRVVQVNVNATSQKPRYY